MNEHSCNVVKELTGTSTIKKGTSLLTQVLFVFLFFNLRKYARHRKAVELTQSVESVIT